MLGKHKKIFFNQTIAIQFIKSETPAKEGGSVYLFISYSAIKEVKV